MLRCRRTNHNTSLITFHIKVANMTSTEQQYQSEIKKPVGALTSFHEIYIYYLRHERKKKKNPVKLLFSLPINTLMHTCKYYANGMLIGGVAAKQPCCSNDW